jgi:outer membrane receptor protein involved in Fe transport
LLWGRSILSAGFSLLWCAAALAADPAPDERTADYRAEIIITGERVRRSVRDTASSVAVAKQREIEAGSADRVDQILAMVPNVQLGSGSQGPAIRGLDTTGALVALPAFLGGNRPRTTLIVDGRRDTYSEFVFGAAPVWDIDRIEVFRSPQTTTQGQNSIAGAIFVYSNDPTSEPEYRARIIGGNYHTRQLSAVASGPLASDVAMRVSGDLRYARTTSRIADQVEGADPNHDVYGIARAKLLVTPRGDPGGRFELTYAHTQSQAPQIVGIGPPFRERRDPGGFYGTFRLNVDALTATAHQPLADDITADVIVTGGVSDARRLAFPGLGQTKNRARDWSAEATVNWSPEGSVKVVGGASHTHLTQRQIIDLSVLSGIGRFRDEQDGTGVFGEATINFMPRATLTVGMRYQQDRQVRQGTFAAIPLDYDRTFHAWLPKLSLAYDVSPAVRGGVLVQRAYNPGGTTLRFDTGQPDNFEAERLWDYEAFVRARLAGGKVHASANVFYYDMRNAQRAKDIFILAPGGFGVGFSDLFNAPKAYSYGAEVEVDWGPTDRLTARFAVGWLNDRIVRSGPGYEEFQGKRFARSPHLTAAASIDWDATPRLRLSAQGRYHSRYADDLETPDLRVDRAAIFDARAEYRLRGAAIFAYARNLFDKFALISVFDPMLAEAENPREVGIGIEKSL